MSELLQYVCYYVLLGSVRAESLYYDLLDEPCCFILYSYVILDLMVMKAANWNRLLPPSVQILSFLPTLKFVCTQY